MNKWAHYGLLNAAVGLFIGSLIAIVATGKGFFIFIAAAPAAAFLSGGFFWKIINNKREGYTDWKVILTGLLTGTVSHYITFILLSIGMNLCFWTTGGCTDSLGGAPASVFSMLTGAFAFSFFSLLFFGWLTVPLSVAAGFLVTKRKSNTLQQSM